MNVFQKAYNGLNLTPGERAFIKVLESLGYSALIAGLFTVYTLLSDSPTPDWGKVLYTALGAVVISFLLGLSKYLKAQGDPLLGTTIETVATQVERQLRPITSNAYIPPDARQQIAALPPIRRPTLSPNVDYQTAPIPTVGPARPDYTTMVNPQATATQFVPPPIIQPPAWIPPNLATGMTEFALQPRPQPAAPNDIHWGDSQAMPTVPQQ